MKPGRRTFAGLLALGVLLLYGTTSYAKKKDVPRIVVVNIGARNTTFNGSRFPDLTFLYTPGLVSQARVGQTGKAVLGLVAGKAARANFKGTPEILEKWWDEKDLRQHAVLFDSQGVGSWEGWIDRRGDIRKSKGYGDKDQLSDMLKRVVEKGKTTKLDAKKTFNPRKNDALLKTRMPEFDVTTSGGETKPIGDFLGNGRPTLVVFVQIPADVNLQEAKESGKGKSAGGFFKAMAKGAAASKWETVFVDLEGQFYDHDSRE